MATSEAPKLTVKLSLSRSTYHFSEPTPPELSLVITSNCDRPLTIFTWGKALWPKLALAQQKFRIIDLTDNAEVTQTAVQIQRMPHTRIRGSADETYYMTIVPGVPATVSAPFGRPNFHPRPKAVAQQGWELDDEGNEMKVRRSIHALGVDGLEPGHRYRLDVKRMELEGIWWRWGTKEDYLVDPDTQGAERMWNSGDSEQDVLVFEPIEGIEFSVEE